MDGSQRRHHRERVIARRLRLMHDIGDHRYDATPGILSKRTPFGCGQPRCNICHSAPKGHPRRRAMDQRAGEGM